MKWLTRFGRFWFDFVVGDDWTIAIAVVVAIAGTYALAHHGWNPWWLLPAVVTAVLGVSLWRASRAHDRAHRVE